MKNLKPFNLEHALITRSAKDERGNLYKLDEVNIIKGFMRWVNRSDRVSCCSDFEGKVILKENSFMYSSEETKRIETIHLAKKPKEAEIYVVFGEDKRRCPELNIRHELMVSWEGDDIVSVDFKKVE